MVSYNNITQTLHFGEEFELKCIKNVIFGNSMRKIIQMSSLFFE